jgi:hypothetical protein
MAKPPPKPPQHIVQQNAPSTGGPIGTPQLRALDRTHITSETFLRETALYNVLNCSDAMTQTTSEDMVSTLTLISGPIVDASMTPPLAASTKTKSHGQNPVRESDENLWRDFVIDLRNALTNTAKKQDAYNEPISHQMNEGELDTYIAKFRSLAIHAGFDPMHPTTIGIFIRGLWKGLLHGIPNRETQLETSDEWTTTAREKQKRRSIVRAPLGQNDPNKTLGGKTMEQCCRTPQLPNQRHHPRRIDQNRPRDPKAMAVDNVRFTLTEEVQRWRIEVVCLSCFIRGHVSCTCSPKSKNRQGRGTSSVRTQDVTHNENHACGNESDNSHTRASKTEWPAPRAEEGVAKKPKGGCSEKTIRGCQQDPCTKGRRL